MAARLRLRAWSSAIAAALIGLCPAPTTAETSACRPDARVRVQGPGIDYQRIQFTASVIDPGDPAYAWESLWGRIGLIHGALMTSPDPALRQVVRYDWTYSIGLLSTGQYIQFEPASHADRAVVDIRIAAAPELILPGHPIGSTLTRARPGAGPAIANYRFQMAEPLMGSASDALGLYRRTGRVGARTLLVLFSPSRDQPGSFNTRIVGRSNLAFSLISQNFSQHGGYWGFTVFTEAECPGQVAKLFYHWFLYIPDSQH